MMIMIPIADAVRGVGSWRVKVPFISDNGVPLSEALLFAFARGNYYLWALLRGFFTIATGRMPRRDQLSPSSEELCVVVANTCLSELLVPIGEVDGQVGQLYSLADPLREEVRPGLYNGECTAVYRSTPVSKQLNLESIEVSTAILLPFLPST